MLEKWTGDVIGKMHVNGITLDDVAKQMGVTKAYLSMILNGKRKPANIRKRIETAVDELLRGGVKQCQEKKTATETT